MKILALASSPRRSGNSETLLDAALSGIYDPVNESRVVGADLRVGPHGWAQDAHIKKAALADLKISPCTGCLACSKTGECVIKDDMQVLYEDLLAADILLVASPIYFKGLPCQLKCVIDRCQALWARKYILKKTRSPSLRRGEGRGEGERTGRASAILVCASSGMKDMFTGALITLKAWFKTLDYDYDKKLLAEGLEEEAAALRNKRLLGKAFNFGKKL